MRISILPVLRVSKKELFSLILVKKKRTGYRSDKKKDSDRWCK